MFRSTLTIRFYYASSQQGAREEYLVYDLDSFIADSGGFLGLLLGHSMLSIFQIASKWSVQGKYCSYFS